MRAMVRVRCTHAATVGDAAHGARGVRRGAGDSGSRHAREIAVLVLLSTFLGLLAVGVPPRFRWTFSLFLIAFLLILARVPVGRPGADRQAGASRRAWYLVLQGGL